MNILFIIDVYLNISILKKLIENKIQWLLFRKKFKTLKFHHSDHFCKIFTSYQLLNFYRKKGISLKEE